MAIRIYLTSRGDLEAGEVSLGARSDPECDAAFGIAQFEVVDDQARLVGSVDVEARFGSIDDDLVTGPDAGLEIHIGLVFLGRFLAEAGKIVVRAGTVLSGVVAADLVGSAAVGGAEVNVLVAL